MKRYWFLIATCIGICHLVTMAIAQQFVTDGLIGFWSLDKNTIGDNTVKDLWGDNDGTIIGTPEVVKGVIGEALEFDGSRDLVQLPDMGKSDTATVEAWILPRSFPVFAGIVSAPTSDPVWCISRLRLIKELQ